MEKELKKVIFIFKDDKMRVLEGKELSTWVSICYLHSDYLLPGNETMVLASRLGGLITGFVPPEIAK